MGATLKTEKPVAPWPKEPGQQFNSLVSPAAFSAGLEMLASAKNISHALLSTAVIGQMTAQDGEKVGASLNPKNAQSITIALVDGILQQDPFITRLVLLSRAWNEHIIHILSVTKPDHQAITAIDKFKCTQFCPADLIVAIISSQRANAVELPATQQLISCTVPSREGADPGKLHYSPPIVGGCATVVIQAHEIAVNTYLKNSPNYHYNDALRAQAEQFVATAIAQDHEPKYLLDIHSTELSKDQHRASKKLKL